MKHSVEWQEDAINAVPEERATVGDLRLWLNGQNVTTHLSGRHIQDHVTVALYGLANGLVHDWWTIFGSRDREISFCKYRTGYLLPDVRVQFDGAAFELSAHEAAYLDPDVRFFSGTQEVMSRADGENCLSNLIQDILGRLVAAGHRDNSASLRWERVQRSRRSDERHFCEAAGSLGLDPYEIADEAADFIEQAEQIFIDEKLVEFVGGAPHVNYSRLIKWVRRMDGIKGGQYRLANLRPLVDELSSATPHADEPAWSAGYRHARAMRKALNLKQSQSLESFRALAEKLGSSKHFNVAPQVNGIIALRREAPDGIHVHIRNHGEKDYAPSMHLFALARAVGDAACFPDKEVAPINSLHRAYRQAAGRAFAAEFLAPIDEILSMIADEKDEVTIATAFGVAPTVIQHQLANRNRIKEACRLSE